MEKNKRREYLCGDWIGWIFYLFGKEEKKKVKYCGYIGGLFGWREKKSVRLNGWMDGMILFGKKDEMIGWIGVFFIGD